MQPLSIETRSGRIECIHYGYVCITDANGKIIYHLGDPNTKIYLRSSAKPFIAIPFVESGAIRKYGMTMDEVAVICSSHSGQDFQRETVHSILHKLGLNEGNLQCGCAEPYNKNVQDQLIKEGKRPTPLYNCCSGKHAGMLALCKFCGYPIDHYNDADHPVQKLILKTMAELIGCSEHDIILGMDGCTVPSFMITLHQHSFLYALLAAGYQAKSKYSQSLGLINEAMRNKPRMVIGDGELCTELMKACKSKVIGKVGELGVYCVSIPEKNLGICIKIIDGKEEAVYPVVIRLLEQLDVLKRHEVEQLETFAHPKVTDNFGRILGSIASVVDIEKQSNPDLFLGQTLWK